MDARKAWLRLAGWIGTLVAVAVARHFLFPDIGPEDARQVIEKAGPWAHVVLVFVFAVAGAVFLPLSWLMVVSGAAFGLPWAFLWSYAGLVGGSMVGYVVARQARGRFRDWLEGRLPDVFTELDHGTWALTTVRALPIIPDSMFNAAAGVCRFPFRRFSVALAIGAVPAVLAYTMLGTVIGGLRLDDPGRWPWSLAAAVAAVTVFVGLGAWLAHRGGLFQEG